MHKMLGMKLALEEKILSFVTYTIIQNITISEICALHLTHPSAHPEPMLWRLESSWGFSALLKGHTSVGVLKVERMLIIHSPHRRFLPEPRFEPTNSGYKSDALLIWPRLPPLIKIVP